MIWAVSAEKSLVIDRRRGFMRHERGRMPYRRGFIRYRRGCMLDETPFMAHERGLMPYQTPFIGHETPLIGHETPCMPYRRGFIAYQRGPSTHERGPSTHERGPLTRERGPLTRDTAPVSSMGAALSQWQYCEVGSSRHRYLLQSEFGLPEETVVITPLLRRPLDLRAERERRHLRARIAGSRSPESTRSWSTSRPIGRTRRRAVTRAGRPSGPDMRYCLSTACLPSTYVVVATGSTFDS